MHYIFIPIFAVPICLFSSIETSIAGGHSTCEDSQDCTPCDMDARSAECETFENDVFGDNGGAVGEIGGNRITLPDVDRDVPDVEEHENSDPIEKEESKPEAEEGDIDGIF